MSAEEGDGVEGFLPEGRVEYRGVRGKEGVNKEVVSDVNLSPVYLSQSNETPFFNENGFFSLSIVFCMNTSLRTY